MKAWKEIYTGKNFLNTKDLTLEDLSCRWHVPIGASNTLGSALEQMDPFRLDQSDVPFIIQLVENPKYKWIFPGRVSLRTHDCIHALLGRGLLPKDEAFVIGFTMGSTGKMTPFKERLFLLIIKYLYPKGYRFGREEFIVFRMGVALGELSGISDLTKVDFCSKIDVSLPTLRQELNIDEKSLILSYQMEQDLFPESVESKRLLVNIK